MKGYAFGPVPSRRLGRSLGINNIPPKICSYSCVYCQLGGTIRLQIEREAFYRPEEIVAAVEQKVEEVRGRGESVDYLTFVPDGEPTLDLNLGREIELLKPLGIPIAVITNSSLIWREDVRQDLLKSDWVSLKADGASEEVWQTVNRPHGRLSLQGIQAGMRKFAHDFQGELVTETMLVAGLNDGEAELERIANLLGEIEPEIAYIAIPTRPPAESWVQPPDEGRINLAYNIFSERLANVEYLIGYEGDAFASTGDVEEDLLSITAVHPMRREAVERMLERVQASWEVIARLIAEGRLVELEYGGHKFYMRRLPTVRR